MIALQSNIRDAFVQGEHVVLVFVGLEKAYDTTFKYGILEDLHEMGLRGRVSLFIKQIDVPRFVLVIPFPLYTNKIWALPKVAFCLLPCLM